MNELRMNKNPLTKEGAGSLLYIQKYILQLKKSILRNTLE